MCRLMKTRLVIHRIFCAAEGQTRVSTCTVCKDAGGCPNCRGTGTLKGKRCLICRGDGACPVCKRPSDPAAAELILSGRRVSPADGQSSGRSLAGAVGGQSPGNLSLAAVARPSVAGDVVPASSPEPPVVVARWSNARLTARAVLALLFLVAFYAFALATIGVLLLITWAQVQLFNRPGGGAIGVLLFLPPLAALAILLAILPRGPHFGYPGRGLNPKRAPELFEFLREVASQTRQMMPRAVYLLDEPNAFFGNRGLFLGKAIGIGLPFFEILTVSELRAVLAHEFGHSLNNAGPITRTAYRATRTFGAATAAAGVLPFLDGVFEVWTDLFLRLAMPISRQYELRCDEARVPGRGRRDRDLRAKPRSLTSSQFSEIANPVPGWQEDLHSTHPPLLDRVASARALGLPNLLAPADDRPAKVLLQSLLQVSCPDVVEKVVA
jgi:Zn-dependent protease with chaperone function